MNDQKPMDDWSNFNKIYAETYSTTQDNKGPSVFKYLLIKATENWILAVLIIFVFIFAIWGLFIIDNTNEEKINWCLHAGELCLGVFLGLFKKSK